MGNGIDAKYSHNNEIRRKSACRGSRVLRILEYSSSISLISKKLNFEYLEYKENQHTVVPGFEGDYNSIIYLIDFQEEKF